MKAIEKKESQNKDKEIPTIIPVILLIILGSALIFFLVNAFLFL
ncbi:MAG: hypothetical protein N3A61_06990 [Ignavibacteria bacterium]|nr:hypothetical protein [Ignavibacteria bacterium]